MNKYRIITVAVVFMSALTLGAQQQLEKLSKTVNANKDVTFNLDTNFTNIEIEKWDKNQIQVVAYIESKDLSEEELKELSEHWNVELDGSGSKVTLRSHGGFGGDWNFNFDFNGFEALDILKDIDIDIPEIPEMPDLPEMPEIPELNIEIPELPELPEMPELPEGVHNVRFDVEKYKKEGEVYLEKWGQEFEDKYGKGYKEDMKKWAREFAKIDWDDYSVRMEKWGEDFGKKFDGKWAKDMEEWGKEYSKKFDGEWAKEMEKWGEKFGEQFGKEWEEKGKIIEERMEEFEKEWEGREEEFEEKFEKRFEEFDRKNDKVKKTIKIKMPRDAKLKVNVRHGELKFTSVIHNLKADLKHSSLLADVIDGSETSINASYSPILVNQWNAGELKLRYVEDALLKRVKTLVLYSNSSNIDIDYLAGNSVIDGSFGDLTIHNIQDSFKNLNIVLENSDANIKLPKADFSLQFKGSRTKIKHPENSKREYLSSYSMGNLTSDRAIVINAKYSNIFMQ